VAAPVRRFEGEAALLVNAGRARQLASGYVGAMISHMMGGDEPALLWSRHRLVWRVPIVLTSPAQGVLGVVAALDVDARTGQLMIPADFLEQVTRNAQTLLVSC
jgi:hypothetical protein